MSELWWPEKSDRVSKSADKRGRCSALFDDAVGLKCYQLGCSFDRLLSYSWKQRRKIMGIEIERKFLVTGDAWKSVEPIPLRQGYLNTDKSRTVRVRTAGSIAFLTIKGLTTNVSRAEFEYPIPLEDAEGLLLLCSDSIIEKQRYTLPIGDLVWEVDEFSGANQGLVIAEVELEFETQKVSLPDWIGVEVSNDLRYYNSSLAKAPFSGWRNEK